MITFFSSSTVEGNAVHTPIETSLKACTNFTELNLFTRILFSKSKVGSVFSKYVYAQIYTSIIM